MKKLKNLFRNYEEVKLGNTTLNIEHSCLENIFGCALGGVAIAITSPIWIPTSITYGLYSLGKCGYDKLKAKEEYFMEKDELREYPKLSADPDMDFEFSRDFHGRGMSTVGIGELKMPSKESIVYTLTLMETDEVVNTPTGFKRVCRTDANVCGYKVEPKGILKCLKRPKVRPVQEEEKKEIRSMLVEKLKESKPKKLGNISFIY